MIFFSNHSVRIKWRKIRKTFSVRFLRILFCQSFLLKDIHRKSLIKSIFSDTFRCSRIWRYTHEYIDGNRYIKFQNEELNQRCLFFVFTSVFGSSNMAKFPCLVSRISGTDWTTYSSQKLWKNYILFFNRRSGNKYFIFNRAKHIS